MKGIDRLTQLFGRAAQDVLSQDVAATSASAPEPTHTVSFRVTEKERDRLNNDSAGVSRSAYIRDRLFGSSAEKRKTRGKNPVKDFEALARVLSLLGRSNLADDLNELDWAVQNGVVKIDPVTALAIKQACVDIATIRQDLIIALGLKPEKGPP
jgi:hypothetical protein